MPRILALASSLGFSATTRQLAFVSQQVIRPDDTFHVVGPAATSPIIQDWFAPGTLKLIPAEVGPLRLRSLISLREQIQAADPDVMLVVGAEALRTIACLRVFPGTFRHQPRLLYIPGTETDSGLCHSITRNLLRWNRGTVITFTEGPRQRWQGIAPVESIPLAVLPSTGDAPPLPSAPFIAVAGGFDRQADLRAAVWSFDILHYLFPEMKLVLIGDGPLRGEVRRFTQQLSPANLYFLDVGTVADPSQYFEKAELVWVTHRSGGAMVALEAFQAGKAVIALDSPDLAGIVIPEENGLRLSRDPVEFARVTRELLADRARADKYGNSGRGRLASQHNPAEIADRWRAVLTAAT